MQSTVEQFVRAPLEKVWQAWISAEDIEIWQCSRHWHTRHCRLDVRLGGRFCFTLSSANDVEQDVAGTVTRVVPSKLLEWVTDKGRVITVTFTAVAGGVRVEQTIDDPTELDPILLTDRQEMLASFARYLE
ncbi:SRPBCC domain-containing protein [Gallaecimonas mangrovi]|uniref:SRPBCC domain-containing protein n=1 Tax=Gallaecimonas mangrovi TaxID=2291597 RepID=UPI000E2041BF|nr:SRPBCC domain-containing protein [Gallaecimonas mangrovi]